MSFVPHRLPATLIESLERLNLGFLWNYIAIIGGIVISLALILVAQNLLQPGPAFDPACARCSVEAARTPLRRTAVLRILRHQADGGLSAPWEMPSPAGLPLRCCGADPAMKTPA